MTTAEAKQQTRLQVQAAAAVCEDKKGEDTRILELDPVDSGLSDFFLVTSATNDRQAVAIADEIEDRLKKQFGVRPISIEGRSQGEWVLLDYFNFVVHVFLTERRTFYDIERLRKSAKPFTPAEFDAELKAALSAKTLAVRTKAAAAKAKPPAAKAKTVPAKKAVPVKKAAKKAAVKAVKKSAAPVKAAAAKTPTKKAAAKKTSAKKAPAKKVVAKKSAAKLVPLKKTAAKKAPAKKTAAKKVADKKAPAKKTAAKKK